MKTEVDRQQWFLARMQFELLVHRSKGAAYQDLFNKVLGYRYPKFIPMQPYGNVGDRKNDGFDPSTGTYFQVYAPKNAKHSLKDAAKKAKNDFKGLFNYWNHTCAIQCFKFAFNDEFGGSVVPLQDVLSDIASDFKIRAEPYLAHHLQNDAMELPLHELEAVIGNILTPELSVMANASFDAIRSVVEHVLRAKVKRSSIGTLATPKLETKIRFNSLSESLANYLRVAAFQIDAVTDYFQMRPAMKQELRDHLNSIYNEQSRRFKRRKNASDLVFLAIHEKMIPKEDCESSIHNAAFVLMAYYFEACDIFESP